MTSFPEPRTYPRVGPYFRTVRAPHQDRRPPTLLEREAALGAVASLVERVGDGSGGALFVVAEAGLGKSTLLQHAVEGTRPGTSVVSVCADGAIVHVPYGVAQRVLGTLGWEASASAGAASPAGLALQACRSAVEVLALRREPTLLVLDDLHLADADSLALFEYVVRRCGDLGVGVLGALRQWPPLAHRVVLRLALDGVAEIETLDVLSEPAAVGLVQSLSPEPLSPAAVTRATAASGGNPLLLTIVARSAAHSPESSIPVPRAGSPSHDQLDRSLLLARFAALDGPTLDCARAAAVLGTHFWPAIAIEVAALGEAEGDAALERLGASGLIATNADALAGFVHPVLQSSLYDDIPGPLRVRLHARAFDSLLRHGLDDWACDHAVAGGLVGDPRAVGLLHRAGQAAQQAGALHTAAGRLAAAVRLAGTMATPDMVRQSADAWSAVGRWPAALALLEPLSRRADLTPDQRSDVLTSMARAELASGQYAAGAARLEGVLDNGDTAPAHRVGALLDLTMVDYVTKGPGRAVQRSAEAVAVAAGADQGTRAQVAVIHAHHALAHGDLAGVAEADAIAAQVLDARVDLRAGRWARLGVLPYHARICTMLERYEDAERHLELATDAAREVGADYALPVLLASQADLAFRRGRIKEFKGLVGETQAIVDVTPAFREPYRWTSQALLAQHEGRLDEAMGLAREAERYAVEGGRREALPSALLVQAQVTAERDAGEASDLFLRIEHLDDELGVGEPCHVSWAREAILCHLAVDREDAARRVLAWLEASTRRLPCRWPRIAAVIGRAALAERAGDSQQAAALYEEARSLHLHVDREVEHVKTLLWQGAFLRRVGSAGDARTVFSDALSIAEATGALWLAARARSELDESLSGLASRRPRGVARPVLTPAQTRVARLAAMGLQNTEIAARLVISVNTVETHLKHVFTRLGLRSRAELVHHLDGID